MSINTLTPQGRFNFAVNIILGHEGGYSNDPDDPGGETNYGITQIDLNEHINLFPDFPKNVKDLTKPQAEEFYKKVYWDKYNYNAINSLRIATKIFDMSVNMGAHEAHELTQRALAYCGYSHIAIDGILGGITLGAINEICLHGRDQDLINELINESEWFYKHIVEKKPVLEKFLNGWLTRALWS